LQKNRSKTGHFFLRMFPFVCFFFSLEAVLARAIQKTLTKPSAAGIETFDELAMTLSIQ